MSYHCLKRYKDGGICQALTGKIFWSFVYVDDAESGWSRTEKEAQDRTNVKVIQYLKEEGRKEGVYLRMFNKTWTVQGVLRHETGEPQFLDRGFCQNGGFSFFPGSEQEPAETVPGRPDFFCFFSE